MPPRKLLEHVSGRLRIEITEPPEQAVPNLANLKAPPSAELVSVDLEPKIYEEGESRPLTEVELGELALEEAEIRLKSERSDEVLLYRAPSARGFTLRDLLDAVEKTERATRASSQWFEGIDVHHVFFEGLRQDEDGVWIIQWGS